MRCPRSSLAGVPTTYQSDSTTNYELGTRTTFLDNRLSIDVAAFLINWQKIQLSEFVENFTIDANGGSAQSKGFEWTLGLTPVKRPKLPPDRRLRGRQPHLGRACGRRHRR